MSALDERVAPAAPDVEATPATDVPSVAAGYRAHLDGLRAVAVYLVVVFHAGSDRLRSGYLGVDVFFVLSGYLVTQVLLRDLASEGSIRFRRFYARRFRRLLPASFVALLVTAVVYTAVVSPAEVARTMPAFRASFLYYANWYFVAKSSNYFGDLVSTNPVLHFWSLAVEEQFYVAWPLVLAGIVWVGSRLGRHRWNAVRAMVALGGLVSLGWAMVLRVGSPDRAYFGTDSRAYQLLFGALLALTPGVVHRVARSGRAAGVAAVGALVALLALCTSLVDVSLIPRGALAVLVTGALIVALEARPGGLLARVLSAEPVVYLGRVSYGTYLWHWPVIVVIREITRVGSLGLAVVASLVATGLASLSAALVELPIRENPRLNRAGGAVIAVGLTVSLVSGLVVIPRIMAPERAGGTGSATTAVVEGLTPVPASFDQLAVDEERFGDAHDCYRRRPEACVVHRGRGPHVLLIGDSNAQMMSSIFRTIADQQDLTLSIIAVPGCPWQRGLYRGNAKEQAICEPIKEDAYQRVIPALDPDLIVAIRARDPRYAAVDEYQDTPEERAERDATRASAKVLAEGRDLVLIEPFPRAPNDFAPLDCLGRATYTEECRFTASRARNWLETEYEDLADADPRIHVADFDRLACPLLPVCDPMIDGVPVWWDRAHLTRRYQPALVPGVTAYLQNQGLIPMRTR